MLQGHRRSVASEGGQVRTPATRQRYESCGSGTDSVEIGLDWGSASIQDAANGTSEQ